MDGVEAESVHVVGESAAAPDAGDEDGFAAIRADFGEDLFHLGKDGVVAAAGAPADFLVAGVVGGLENVEVGGVGDNAHLGIILPRRQD